MRGDSALGVGYSGRASRHESFLVYSRYRYLKRAAFLGVAAVALYIFDKPYGSRYGGSWAGYILGIVSAGLIVRLLGFGTTLGIIAQTAALVPFLRRVGFRWHPRFDFRRTEMPKTS